MTHITEQRGDCEPHLIDRTPEFVQWIVSEVELMKFETRDQLQQAVMEQAEYYLLRAKYRLDEGESVSNKPGLVDACYEIEVIQAMDKCLAVLDERELV